MSLNFDDFTKYSVSSSIEIAHSYYFMENAFEPSNSRLAESYKPWKRCLAITDCTVCDLYAARMQSYFNAYDIACTVHRVFVPEDRKNMETVLQICKQITDFGLIRREPVLVIGGGVITDVVGFACAIYRRKTLYIRMPTTLIGLIDASVSNRVAVNWSGLKNRLGAYHEPILTIIDPTFLKTLPEREIRNGMAEILKIASCTHLATFELLEQYGESLIMDHFGQVDSKVKELTLIADTIIRQTIKSVLEVEVPNSQEQNLNRVMFFGHTWSPMLELAVVPHMMHGHAISVDMCYSATLAYHLGHISEPIHARFLDVFSRLGLALDHPGFTLELLRNATVSSIATRDGKLRAPIPTARLGSYEILPQVEDKVLVNAWEMHKKIVQAYDRGGLGREMTIASRLPN